jgi:ketosteroid isomerase-like protein
MTASERRIQDLYRAFNGRDFEAFFALLTEDVDWPNEIDGGRLGGQAAVRAYMLEDTSTLRARFEPLQMQDLGADRVTVLARQTIFSAADRAVLSTTPVRHLFHLRGDRIARMEIVEEPASAGLDEIRRLTTTLHDAVERCDIEGVMSVFHPEARMPDGLEHVELVGLDAIRDYYLRQFAAIRTSASVIALKAVDQHRFETVIHVRVRGIGGGLWWEGPLPAVYQTRDGRIIQLRIGDPPTAGDA